MRVDDKAKDIEPFAVGQPVLRAAYETLLKQGWIVARSTEAMLLLERDRLAVHILFVPRLDNALLRKISRKVTVFSVVLAIQIERPINLSLHVIVIDLTNSSHHGPPFPDAAYRELFKPFLSITY